MSLYDVLLMILIQVIFFVLLVWGLKFYFSKHLSLALKRLKAIQEDAMVKEAQLNEELNRAKQHREAIVEGAKEEAKELVEEAKQEISSMRNSAAAAAYAEKQKVMDLGKKEMESLKSEFKQQSKVKAIEHAVDIVHTILQDSSLSILNERLVAEVLIEIEKLPAKDFMGDKDNIVLRSAQELSSEHKNELHRILKSKLSEDINIEFVTDASIVGGMILSIGEFVADGTLKNKIEKVVAVL